MTEAHPVRRDPTIPGGSERKPTMGIERRTFLLLAAAGWLPAAGCATTGAIGGPRAPAAEAQGAGGIGYFYSTGRGIQEFAAAPTAVKAAVNEAMDDLGMTVTHRRHDGPVSQIDGRTADDRAVVVTVRPRQGRMQVACRIGWFGDDPLSRSFMQRVAVRLGTAPPAPIPEKPPSAPTANPIFSRDAIPNSIMLRDRANNPYPDRPDF
jgi:hypothetical protein